MPASKASAEIAINFAGPGAGEIESDKTGNGGSKIECTNAAPGVPGPNCAESFAAFTPLFEPNGITLTVTPGAGYVFEGWTGDNPFGFFFSPSCNEGSGNPCKTIDPADALGPTTVHITATFGCAPPVAAPEAITGGATTGEDSSLQILKGEVDPEACGLEESYFEYGPTTEYGSTTPTAPNPEGIGRGSTPVEVSAETEPLEPNTTYHYRLVVSNPGGTARGDDRTFTTGPAESRGCPNEEVRRQQGIVALHLPDCMALEMVSPPLKAGQAAKFPNVSSDGSRLSFISLTALGENVPALLSGATYVTTRDNAGWTPGEMTVPDVGPHFALQWELISEIRPSFTPDFSRWLGIGSTLKQWQQRGAAQAYEAGLGGFFRPLAGPFSPLSGVLLEALKQSTFQGASADHSHLYFKVGGKATYFPADPDLVGSGNEHANIYLARSAADGPAGVLELLSRDRTGKVWGGNCGARLGGIGALLSEVPAPNGERNQGTVSADGSRTYFSARAAQSQNGPCEEENKLRILERLETPSGPYIAPLFSSECSRIALPDPPGPCKELIGNDLYQGASVDGSKVYFTTNRQLASSDSDGSDAECSGLVSVAGCDLYLYDHTRPAGERLTQVSAGEDVLGKHTAGKEAGVFNGITAISADGSHVYFVATGVLTEDTNSEGDGAQEGKPNLYLWDTQSEKTTFLATLAPALTLSDPGDAILSNAGDGLWGGQGTWRNNAYPVPLTGINEEGNEVGGDGHILVFESRAELTGADGDGRHLDVYRYDAGSQTLQCLSCAPGSSASEPDDAPFDVEKHSEEQPLGTDFAESRRWVSEDGEEVSFITPEPLLPGDVNGADDFYLWRRGALTRLPGKPAINLAATNAPVFSHDGSTIAFSTVTPLLPQDGDTAPDVYIAREDGGFLHSPPGQPCQPGVNCQGSEKAPSEPLSSSNTFVGPGNPKPPRCPKGKVRRKGRCVSRHGGKGKGHAKKRRTRNVSTDRRTGK